MFDKKHTRQFITDAMMEGYAKIDRALDEKASTRLDAALDELIGKLLAVRHASTNCGGEGCEVHGPLNRYHGPDTTPNTKAN